MTLATWEAAPDRVEGADVQVVLPAHLGDNVLAMAPIRAAARAASMGGWSLSLVGAGRGAELLESQVDGVDLRPEACSGQPSILLGRSFRSAWRALRAGARPRVGLAGDARGWLLHGRVNPSPERDAFPAIASAPLLCREPQQAQYARLFAETFRAWRLPEPVRQDGDARLRLSSLHEEAGARTFLRLDRPDVLIHPVASGLATKVGLASSWRALAGRLRVAGFRVAWTGGPGDADRLEAFRGTDPVSAGPTATSPLAWAALARLCKVVIVPDTGLSHVAAAAGATVWTAFGPTEARRHPPGGRSTGQAVTGSFQGCTGCYRARCRFETVLGTVPCIDDALLRIGAAVAVGH